MSSTSISPSHSRPGTASTLADTRRVGDSPVRSNPAFSHFQPSSYRNRAQTMDAGPKSAPISRCNSDFSMSTFPSLEKLPSASSDLSYRPSSRSTRASTSTQSRDDKSANLAKSLLSRSSRLLHKRKSSNRVRTLGWLDDEEDPNSKDVQELSNRRRSRHNRAESEGFESSLKHSISEPYNFQHLTHTAPHQAKALRTASPRDLVSELSAIRASQAPRPELKGIKAETIQSTNALGITSGSPSLMFDSYSFCRPITPQVLQTGFESRPPLRASKSIDSFKRLSSKSFSSPKPPISPPPRRSSKNSPGLTQTVVTPARKHTQESPTVPDFGSAIAQSSSSSSRFSSPNSGAEETIFVGSSEIAQAVTTPDDSALMLVSRQVASPAAGLEDVPEEEESSIWMANPANCSMSGAVRHARSFPSSRLFSQPCATETSMPNVDGSATSDPILPLPQHQVEDIPQHPLRMSKRVSMAPGGMEDCWEDDIDYCYEHALEAYGDEAWDDVSRDSPFAGTVPASPFAGWDTAENVTPRGNSNTGSPYFDIPELQTEATSSAMSSSITMPGIVTPSEALPSPHVLSVPRDASGSIMFPLSPSMIIPKEYLSHGTEEDALQETLGEQEIKQPFYSTEVEGDAQSSYSQRCSSSSASKYTSSDGFSIGNRHSTSTGTGSRHRNSSSVGSIPELVPSRNSKQATEDADDLSDTGDSFLTMAEVSKNLPPIPARSPLRSRASSDSVGRTFQTMAGVRPVESGRMRSASNAALAGTRPKTHRTSYSLFPQTAPRY